MHFSAYSTSPEKECMTPRVPTSVMLHYVQHIFKGVAVVDYDGQIEPPGAIELGPE